MKITNVKVYGLAEAILASGFPMGTHYDEFEFKKQKELLERYLDFVRLFPFRHPDENGFSEQESEWCAKQIKRARILGGCDGGESHDCYLCGITVHFNVTAPRYWFPEMQRYHFADIISSFSTMHRLKTNMSAMIEHPEKIFEFFGKQTDRAVIDVVLKTASNILSDASIAENEKIERVKAILPEGYLQTCRITTNYRQLKTWRRQRNAHRLSDWREVCEWIDTLPLFTEIVGKEN